VPWTIPRLARNCVTVVGCVSVLALALLLPNTSACAEPRTVRVGIYQNEPKIFMAAPNGDEPSGIFVDLLEAVAQEEGWTLVWVQGTWEEGLAALSEGTIDLMPDVAYSTERDRLYDFHSTPVVDSWSYVYAAPGVRADRVSQLTGKRVAVLRGSIQESVFRQMAAGFGYDVELVPAASLNEAFQLAAKGGADAAIANYLFGDYYFKDYGLTKTPIVFNDVPLHYATAEGQNSDLLAGIELHLRAWVREPGSVYYETLTRYTAGDSTQGVPRYLWWALGSVLGLLVLSAGLILLLRWQVRVRTRDLAVTNAALAEAEETLQLALDAAEEGIFDWRPKTGEVTWSRCNYTMLGYEADEFPIDFDTWVSLVHPDDRVRVVEEELQQIHVGDRSFKVEHRLQTKSGEWLWVVGCGRAVELDAEGNVERVMGTNTDVTQHRRAQEATSNSSRLLESLVAIMRRPFSTTQEFLDSALEEALRLTGSRIGYIFRYDEVAQRFALSSWSSDVMPECGVADPMSCYELSEMGVWGEVVRQRQAIILNDFAAEHPLKRGYPQGHIPLSRYLSLPVIFDDRIVAVVGVANKETDYHADLDALQLSLLMDGVWKEIARVDEAVRRRELDTIVSRSPAIAFTWSTDAGRPIDFVSDNVSQLGYDAEALIRTHRHYADLICPADLHRVSEAVRDRIANGAEQIDLEYRVMTTDGRERWVAESSWIVQPPNEIPRRTQGVLIDVTQRRVAELELESYRDHLEALVDDRTLDLTQANEELAQTLEKLTEVNRRLEEATAAKSRFLAHMSHELRTPLNSIIGFSSLLSTGMAGPLTEEQVLQTTRIHTSGHQLLQLINEILDLSTIEAGVIRVEIERIDAGAIAADVAETLRPLAEQKSIGLRVELPPGRIEMVTDGDRLRQILMNLVGNAVKFTASGEVELRAEYGNDSRVSFVVSDTGPGIPADEIESIFEAFRQVENVRNHRPQGTGLGLTISANLARRLGGEIVVSSEVGAGSVFTLWLPDSAPQEA
jgi:PAS domain S-box-containing protein